MSNAAECKRGRLRSTFGGVVEEPVSCLAVHFRYLAQVLDAYGKRCPKIDRFVRRLQLSDTGVSGRLSPKRNVAQRSYLVCD